MSPAKSEILDRFRDDYLSYLEGYRADPPPFPDAVHREAELWVESITAARGVDPYANTPSIEWLLAARKETP